MIKFVLVLYVFIAGISCSMVLMDSAEENKGAGPTDVVSQCRNYRGVSMNCPAGNTHCGFLKCTGGDFVGCLELTHGITPRLVCSSDNVCQGNHMGSLRHGAHVCQICASKNCNTGKDGDGGWYQH